MELNWVEIVISILTGLAAAIPLVVKLVEYVQKAVKEKNWNKMLDMVMDLMQTAEVCLKRAQIEKNGYLP